MHCRFSLPLLVALFALASGAADDLPFEVVEIPGRGRTAAAELVDLDGDGLADLMQIAVLGMPPEERRVVRVHLQAASGEIPTEPSFEVPLPGNVAVYDLADLRAAPGQELVLLHRSGITLLSLASPGGRSWELTPPGPGTVGAAEDERGLKRVQLVWGELADEPRLLVPRFGDLSVMTPRGEPVASLQMEGLANYWVPRQPGLFLVESDLRLLLDAPRIAAGDVNGDGRADVLAATRHEVRIFLQGEAGSFPSRPDQVLALHLISERDHIRGSGGVSTRAGDLDGDGAVDLVVSHASGGFADARSETRVLLNRGGGWDLEQPAGLLSSRSTIGSDMLLDVDGDGRLELLQARTPFSVLELIEVLVTRSIDSVISVHRFEPGKGFGEKPWTEVKLGIPISFETFRSKGFFPSVAADLNGDGHVDLVDSGGGRQLEIYLGGPERRWRRLDARQKLDTRGQLQVGDLEGDGLDDLLVFDPHTPDASLRVARNRGRLPGSRAETREGE